MRLYDLVIYKYINVYASTCTLQVDGLRTAPTLKTSSNCFVYIRMRVEMLDYTRVCVQVHVRVCVRGCIPLLRSAGTCPVSYSGVMTSHDGGEDCGDRIQVQIDCKQRYLQYSIYTVY